MNEKIQKLLKDFNENQIRDINEFLNSAQGAGLRNKIKNSDKQKLLKEFENLDPRLVKQKLKGIKSEDILKIINSL